MQTPATPTDATPDPAGIAIAQSEARLGRRRRWLIVCGVASLLMSYLLGPKPITIMEKNSLLSAEFVPILRGIYAPVLFVINTVSSTQCRS